MTVRYLESSGLVVLPSKPPVYERRKIDDFAGGELSVCMKW